MTEQPLEPVTEQAWLGNRRRPAQLPGGHRVEPQSLRSKFLNLVDDVFDKAEGDLFRVGLQGKDPAGRDPLLVKAEENSESATSALSSGELDDGIAHLQAALAFALNYRHAIRFDVEKNG